MKMTLPLALVFTVLITATFACLPGAGIAEVPAQGAAYMPLYDVADGTAANKIVVISDTHLGVDDAYSETVQNKQLLVDFLHRVAATDDIAEVVIAGDFFDEWFQPFSAAPHADCATFYRQVAQNNADVINAIEELMTTYGKKVTYIPGNHDMTLDFDTVASVLPGINQARDADGLGTYRTGARKEIVIEHGHRYNVFVAPDNITNKALSNGKSILPPGYFFTRIGASYVMEGRPADQKSYSAVTAPDKNDVSKYGAYLYYRMWLWALTTYPVNESLDAKVMDASASGFTEVFSISDVLPAMGADGKLSAKLFNGLQDNWDAVQTNNHVAVHISFNDAVMQSAEASFVDEQAQKQYFDLDPSVEVVVFGHTHAPLLQVIATNKVYANAGTWIDRNTVGETGTFVLIGLGDKADTVALYQYKADGTIAQLSAK